MKNKINPIRFSCYLIPVIIVVFLLGVLYRTAWNRERFANVPAIKDNDCYVINLERNKKRLSDFFDNCRLDSKPQVFKAVDGRSLLDLDTLVRDGIVSEEGATSIRNGPPRTNGQDLVTTGALGCYMSHVELWKRPMKDYALIFEDDAVVHVGSTDIQRRISRLPEDWHIYMLGAPHSVREQMPTTTQGLARLTRFCGTHAYAISRKGVEWLMQHGDIMPAAMQVDAKMSDLTAKGLIIYIHTDEDELRFIGEFSDIQA